MSGRANSAQSNQDDVEMIDDTIADKLDTVIANQELILAQNEEIIEKLTNLGLDR